MTYQDKFVAEVKVNGHILRVKDGAVYLPFGCEYTLYLKNLNSRRASVNVSIDGEDVLDSHSLILDPNSSTELQGFLRGNVARNRFRFINKTKEIADHRGDKADDGMIRVEFAYEKPQPEPWIKKTIEEVHHYEYHHHEPIRWTYYNTPNWNLSRGILKKGQATYSNSAVPIAASASGPPPVSSSTIDNSVSESNVTMDSLEVDTLGVQPDADEGITVKGSEVNQSFRYSSIGQLEDAAVIIINLKGLTGETNKPIQEAITVKRKATCPTCGNRSTSAAKYCANCGTFLE
jgi:hypothetical protein